MSLFAGCGSKLRAVMEAGLQALERAEVITFKRPDNDFDGEHIALLPIDKKPEGIALLTEANTIAAKLVQLSDPKKHPPSVARDEEIMALVDAYDQKMLKIRVLMPKIENSSQLMFGHEKWDTALRESKIASLNKNNLLEKDVFEKERRALEKHLAAIYKKISFFRAGDSIIIVGNSGSHREGTYLGLDKENNSVLFDWRNAVHRYPLSRMDVDETVKASKSAKENSP